GRIKTCQRRHRLAGVMELVVVIVFEDQNVLSIADFVKLQPSPGGEGYRRRVLVQGSEVEQLDFAALDLPLETVDDQALAVDGDRPEPAAGEPQSFERRRIAE